MTMAKIPPRNPNSNTNTMPHRQGPHFQALHSSTSQNLKQSLTGVHLNRWRLSSVANWKGDLVPEQMPPVHRKIQCLRCIIRHTDLPPIRDRSVGGQKPIRLVDSDLEWPDNSVGSLPYHPNDPSDIHPEITSLR
jgi:hypothetical protein